MIFLIKLKFILEKYNCFYFSLECHLIFIWFLIKSDGEGFFIFWQLFII
ncbi:hypothetical protein XBJ1_3795 [Xenorhabdus bovienii SS-2004]|uniref:Uncharacterized protein n=1 Tax=Xenorhabdus bovienii (strain SS-2004) TaxID=406818 RepID=D3V5I4_XENBS|nr:hypothetical protein XBJ1_3795 [Xenorhabdus bovienii SS-2004]